MSFRLNKPIFLENYLKLHIGDYVVHRRHGIAVFDGLKTLEISGIQHDFLSLLYKDGDRLYVPVENISLVSRYGDETAQAQISSLKSGAWSEHVRGVRAKLRIVAEGLVKLAAQRKLQQIAPLKIKQTEYERFCAGFGYPETEGQVRAISEVLVDLQGTTPMDRLVCGDVGFGKTEVALRAAFVVASNGKQVVLLAPTTILVSQHFKNFYKRFDKFDIEICQLSRFVPAKEFESNRRKITSGIAKIIITTHAIFSSKIEFADLGLVIIDEEQHFGVRQKERLKGMAHVMMLSATPIPRTLQMAMSGVRDISLIATPPQNRLPVMVRLCDFADDPIRDAIENELTSGGQVFFVTPRVEYLDDLNKFIKRLFPQARIAQVHGSSPHLEETVRDFCECKIDILVSTNIIDSGIDIPNANTILIHRSDLFGLSQLYQLRGRVGRSKRQAYVYLLMEGGRELTESAQKRLKVLLNSGDLNSSFALASHDLDIRGAGNLLGEEQAGHIKDLGVELYQTMLKEAVLMIKAGTDNKSSSDLDPRINLGIPALIPPSYIADSATRLSIYRDIGNINNTSEIEDARNRMSDAFGELPQEVKNLFSLLKFRAICRALNIEKLNVGP